MRQRRGTHRCNKDVCFTKEESELKLMNLHCQRHLSLKNWRLVHFRVSFFERLYFRVSTRPYKKHLGLVRRLISFLARARRWLAWLTTPSWRFQRSRRGTLSARTILRRNWTPWWWTKQAPRSPQGDWSCISYCSHASGVVWLSSPVTQTTLIRKVLRNNWQWKTSFVSWVWWVNMKEIF